MSAEAIVESSWNPAFSRGPDGSITAWNRGAETLFATPAGSVVGRPCFEVIAGRDVFGNDYCCADCASWRMAAADRPVRPYRLTVTEDGGRAIDLRVSVLTARGRGGRELVHLLESVAGRGVPPAFADEARADGGWGGDDCPLTRRELQVLRQLASGRGTDDIATRLLISRATVRNHISRCLKKLEVHSRVEAVGVARRLDLV